MNLENLILAARTNSLATHVDHRVIDREGKQWILRVQEMGQMVQCLIAEHPDSQEIDGVGVGSTVNRAVIQALRNANLIGLREWEQRYFD